MWKPNHNSSWPCGLNCLGGQLSRTAKPTSSRSYRWSCPWAGHSPHWPADDCQRQRVSLPHILLSFVESMILVFPNIWLKTRFMSCPGQQDNPQGEDTQEFGHKHHFCVCDSEDWCMLSCWCSGLKCSSGVPVSHRNGIVILLKTFKS